MAFSDLAVRPWLGDERTPTPEEMPIDPKLGVPDPCDTPMDLLLDSDSAFSSIKVMLDENPWCKPTSPNVGLEGGIPTGSFVRTPPYLRPQAGKDERPQRNGYTWRFDPDTQTYVVNYCGGGSSVYYPDQLRFIGYDEAFGNVRISYCNYNGAQRAAEAPKMEKIVAAQKGMAEELERERQKRIAFRKSRMPTRFELFVGMANDLLGELPEEAVDRITEDEKVAGLLMNVPNNPRDVSDDVKMDYVNAVNVLLGDLPEEAVDRLVENPESQLFLNIIQEHGTPQQETVETVEVIAETA